VTFFGKAVITAVTTAVLEADAITTGILAFRKQAPELALIVGAQPLSQVPAPSSLRNLRPHSGR